MSANLFPSKKLTPQQVGLLSAAVPSPFGDALGLLADGVGYAQDPASLTPARGLLSLAGLIPGIPNRHGLNLTKAETLNDLKSAASRYGDDWSFGSWAFTGPDGKTFMLDGKVRKALGSKVSDDFLMAHERAIKEANALEFDKLQPYLLNARGGVGDKEAAELVKKIDSGAFGPMNDATAAVEVAAVVLRNRLLKK